MVVIEQCRVDQEGKHLIIDASVENLSYYKNVSIEAVVIDTDETFSENGPSSNAVFSQNFDQPYDSVGTLYDTLRTDEGCDCGNVYTKGNGVKRVRLCLSSRDLSMASLNDNIFFVYIICTGVPSPDTPCSMDNHTTMGVAVNLRPIYNMSMKYIKELDSSCVMPKGFIDMILRIKAFELSLRTGNYITALKQWKKLFKNKVGMTTIKRCGCNGN